MLNNNTLRRLAALALALLLALCAGCGSSNEPAADTPEPSQALTSPEPTADPDADQAPVPEAATTPTDVNAPAGPLPSLESPVEREAPDSLQLLTLGASYTLTNAESQTLTRGSSGVSGSMTFTQQQLPDAGSDIVSVVIPYSTHFAFEKTNVSGDWGFEILAVSCPWCHCVAKGSGKLEGLELDTGNRITVRTEPGAELELTLPMPDGLGENGWIRLHLTAGESEVSLATEGNVFSFSGVDTGASVLLDYGGAYSASGLDFAPGSSSGSASFGATESGAVGFTVS